MAARCGRHTLGWLRPGPPGSGARKAQPQGWGIGWNERTQGIDGLVAQTCEGRPCATPATAGGSRGRALRARAVIVPQRSICPALWRRLALRLERPLQG